MRKQGKLGLLVWVLTGIACGAERHPGGDGPEQEEVAILSFAATAQQVQVGEEVTISWEVAHASGVRLELHTGEATSEWDVEASGSRTAVVGAPQTWRLIAQGHGGPKFSAPLVVEVEPLDDVLRILSFSAQPSEIEEGEATTLLWRTRQAERVRILDADGREVDLEGRHGQEEGGIEVTPTASTTYRLVASKGAEKVEREASVSVAPPKLRIVRFEAMVQGPVVPGEEVPFTWEVRGADALELDNLQGASREIVGEEVAAGSASLPMGSLGKFRLRALRGTEAAQQEVRLSILRDASIGQFWIQPPAVSEPGGIAHLFWKEVHGAVDLWLEVDPGKDLQLTPSVDGEVEVLIEEDTTFTLVASNDKGEARRSEVVSLVPLPRILSFQATPSQPVAGGHFILEWQTLHTSMVRLWANQEAHGQVKDWMLTATVDTSVEVDTEYLLRAYNPAGDYVERTLWVRPTAD